MVDASVSELDVITSTAWEIPFIPLGNILLSFTALIGTTWPLCQT